MGLVIFIVNSLFPLFLSDFGLSGQSTGSVLTADHLVLQTPKARPSISVHTDIWQGVLRVPAGSGSHGGAGKGWQLCLSRGAQPISRLLLTLPVLFKTGIKLNHSSALV